MPEPNYGLRPLARDGFGDGLADGVVPGVGVVLGDVVGAVLGAERDGVDVDEDVRDRVLDDEWVRVRAEAPAAGGSGQGTTVSSSVWKILPPSDASTVTVVPSGKSPGLPKSRREMFAVPLLAVVTMTSSVTVCPLAFVAVSLTVIIASPSKLSSTALHCDCPPEPQVLVKVITPSDG